MISRPILASLVFGLLLLLVAFGVIMGGAALTHATGDGGGAVALRWVGTACLMLLVADLVLLVGALGLNAALPPDRRRDDDSGAEDSEVESPPDRD